MGINRIVFLIISLSLVVIVFAVLVSFFRPKDFPSSTNVVRSQQAALKERTGNVIPIKITKEARPGNVSTVYVLSGIVERAPYLKDGKYFIDLRINNGLFNLILGDESKILGTNVSLNGVLTDNFSGKSVGEVSSLITVGKQIVVKIPVQIKTSSTSSDCDENCREVVQQIEKYGEQVGNKLLPEGNLVGSTSLVPIEIEVSEIML